MGKANCGNEKLAFLASAIKEGRRRRLQKQLASNNRRRFFNLVCFLLLLIAGFQYHAIQNKNSPESEKRKKVTMQKL